MAFYKSPRIHLGRLMTLIVKKSQLMHNSTQPNLTKVVFDPNLTMHTTPTSPFNVINISAVTELI